MDKWHSPLAYQDGEITLENIKLKELTTKFPTPFYLYNENTLVQSFNTFKEAASVLDDSLICYAMKANSNLEVLKTLAKLGAGADIVSGFELKRALEAGIDSQKIIFSGVGKTKNEINYALESNIYSFNVESIEELELINHLANKSNMNARISFRLNPKVMAKTHKHIATGDQVHKFGIIREDILASLQNKSLWTNSKLVGLSIHIGSQLTELDATSIALDNLIEMAKEFGQELEFLDVGGGLGINYEQDSKTININEYMSLIKTKVSSYNKDTKIIFEPGRIIAARAGYFVTSVIRTKESQGHHFLIVDGGMNDFMRPSLYSAYHEIYSSLESSDKVSYDIVGPVCESADTFAHKRELPAMHDGDFIVIADTGAYGQTMSSNYNLRARPAEILLQSSGEVKLVTPREDYSQIR